MLKFLSVAHKSYFSLWLFALPQVQCLPHAHLPTIPNPVYPPPQPAAPRKRQVRLWAGAAQTVSETAQSAAGSALRAAFRAEQLQGQQCAQFPHHTGPHGGQTRRNTQKCLIWTEVFPAQCVCRPKQPLCDVSYMYLIVLKHFVFLKAFLPPHLEKYMPFWYSSEKPITQGLTLIWRCFFPRNQMCWVTKETIFVVWHFYRMEENRSFAALLFFFNNFRSDFWNSATQSTERNDQGCT